MSNENIIGVMGGGLGALTHSELASYAQHLENIGYGALGVLEHITREPVATATYLLANTQKLEIWSATLSIYFRDAITTAQAGHTLAEFYGGRYRLGLGPNTPASIEDRGLNWVPALEKMRKFLETLHATEVYSPPPEKQPPVYLAANKIGMLQLANDLADGIYTNFMPVEHTRWAREKLAEGKELIPIVRYCQHEDREQALALSREHIGLQNFMSAYISTWQMVDVGVNLDVAGNGSDITDDVLEKIVAIGDAAVVAARIDEHFKAGADHVLLLSMTDALDTPQSSLKFLDNLAGELKLS